MIDLNSVKRTLNERLLRNGLIRRRAVSSAEVASVAADFRAACVKTPLIRIGGDGDGGYLVPNDLAGVRHCFSPGVSVTADFEEQIARDYGIKSFLADASVDKPPFDNPLFEFDKKFLGACCNDKFTTLGRWVDGKLGTEPDDDLILQMDIEGAEFDVLIESSTELLRRFRVMVIEFHSMERIFERHSLPLIKAIFAKLHRDFAIVHMHANNCCGIAECNGMGIPRVFEVTYLRRDRLAGRVEGGAFTLPHPLDRVNVPENADILMPPLWWRG
ncbi:Methyltransferase FkbM domain-containing protein [Roseovarius azorensis]|uniref:Methyltransferase FkbM domain-containing protein n=1 Tax=Roseovarius azorensis TaxID=1287727 RepID=A0A1H7VDD6_9RHOB|nr:Methyltransferase FkbM domain-containing protein [Roseovarius azorensis]